MTPSYSTHVLKGHIIPDDICSWSRNLWNIFPGIHCQFSCTAILNWFMMSIFLTLTLWWVQTQTHMQQESLNTKEIQSDQSRSNHWLTADKGQVPC